MGPRPGLGTPCRVHPVLDRTDAANPARAASGEPVPFGRTKSDPERIGAIERDRHEAVSTLWASTREDIALLRTFLSGLLPEQWLDVGRHPTRGPMPVADITEEFLVGHLEQHADQLEGLLAGS